MSTVLHPNGFIQHDLSDGRRLHVWAPDLPVAQKVHTPLHDHTFRFFSRVVLGCLIHEYWSTVTTYDKSATHRIYAVDGPLLVPTEETVRASVQAKVALEPGESYSYGGPQRYHDSRGAGLTATIMEKIETGLAATSHVLVPFGQEPDNDFRRDQYPEWLLLEWVERAAREAGLKEKLWAS